VYSLPFSGNRLKEGWLVSFIETITSGLPYYAADGIDRMDLGVGASPVQERPNLAPGASGNASITPRPVSGGVLLFNPANFQLQPAGQGGNESRNSMRAPGFITTDVALMKDIRITERTRVQVRVDAFNLFDHTTFGYPNVNLFTGTGQVNPTAGIATTTASNARQIQLSAKFLF
jgi:hypothetical protein